MLNPIGRGARARRRGRGGQSLTEFTLVLPLLVLLLLACLHFGIVIWTFIQVEAANREGAIFGAYHPHDDVGIRTTVKTCLPSWVDQNPLYLTITVTGVGTRDWGTRLRVQTTYNIGSTGAVLPGGSLLPTPTQVAADCSTPVLADSNQ